MKASIHKNQRGDITIIVVILLVALVLGGAVYWFFMRDKEATKVTQLNPTLNTSEAREHLDSCLKAGGDDDICTFITGFSGLNGSYTMELTGGEESMKFSYDGQGNSSMTSPLGNIINYNDATYIQSGNVWIKYPASEEGSDGESPIDVDSIAGSFKLDENTPENSLKESYVNLGKEDCGSMECFKYQILENTTGNKSMSLIWFDTGEYKLRKLETADTDGTVFTALFNYDKVTISEPSPVQEFNL